MTPTMPLKPKLIKTESDYKEALARLEQIFLAPPDTEEGDEAELLTLLIEHYETKHHTLPPPSPVAVIRFKMEQMGLSRMDLVPHIGSVHKVNEVLEGSRHLTLSMIQKLAPVLQIPPELLLPREEAQAIMKSVNPSPASFSNKKDPQAA